MPLRDLRTLVVWFVVVMTLLFVAVAVYTIRIWLAGWHRHQWEKWAVKEEGVIRALSLDGKDRVVASYALQERRCAECGVTQYRKDTFWA